MFFINKSCLRCLFCSCYYCVHSAISANIDENYGGMSRNVRDAWNSEQRGGREDVQRKRWRGNLSKDVKKCKEWCEQDGRGSTWWTAGPGSLGSSSGSGRMVNVILSSRRLQMQQPKLYSNLTFQKHGLIRLSLLSLLLPYATHHYLPLTALFHLFSFISLSYSCHISSAPNLFLSISLLLYFSLLLCLVMYLFLMVTLLHSISPH